MSTSPTTHAFTDLSCVKRTFKEINTTSDSKGSLKNIRFSKQFKWVQLSNKMCYYSDVTCRNYIMAYTCYHRGEDAMFFPDFSVQSWDESMYY